MSYVLIVSVYVGGMMSCDVVLVEGTRRTVLLEDVGFEKAATVAAAEAKRRGIGYRHQLPS